MSLRFVQITDHHLTEGDLLRGYSTEHALRTVLRHIAETAGPIDFIVSTGDLVQNGSVTEYRRFLELLGAEPSGRFPGPLIAYGQGLPGIPCYLLPGNHDLRPTMLSSLFPASPPAERLNDWFDHGGLRFICVDWGGENKAQATPELWDVLDRGLDGRPAVILMHHHVTPMGHPRLDTMIADTVADFGARIAGRGVVAILSGHSHATFERELAGVPVWGLRSTCFQFVPIEGPTLCCLLPPHYRIMTLEDGVLHSTIVEVAL